MTHIDSSGYSVHGSTTLQHVAEMVPCTSSQLNKVKVKKCKSKRTNSKSKRKYSDSEEGRSDGSAESSVLLFLRYDLHILN